jgi:hypothetical protein
MQKVFIEYDDSAYRDAQKHNISPDELKKSVQLVAHMNPGYQDYVQCPPIDRGGIKLRPNGILLVNSKEKIIFNCISITVLYPDKTAESGWRPQIDGMTLREYIEQKKKQQ